MLSILTQTNKTPKLPWLILSQRNSSPGVSGFDALTISHAELPRSANLLLVVPLGFESKTSSLPVHFPGKAWKTSIEAHGSSVKITNPVSLRFSRFPGAPS